MKKLIWSLALLSLLISASFSLAAKPVLRVATDAAYAPFESVDVKGNYIGYDMDLIRLVAKELKMDLKITNINFDGIIPGLMNGEYDCLISAMTVTEERKKQINFSNPYFSIKQAIVVKKENTIIKGVENLSSKTVSVQNGTTGDLYVSNLKNIKIKRFDNNPQAIQELLNNNADAAIMDDLVAYHSIRITKGLKVVEIKNAEKEDYGIGIRKDNSQLLEKINKALTNLKKSGKLFKLETKYKSAH